MDCDVAVLGGGPGGYTAAIRAAQLGAEAVCIEKEPELGGTCLRVGCMPTKAWVQTAHYLKEAEETFAKAGVVVGEAKLDMAAANEWKSARRQADDRRRRVALQGERRRVGQGHGPLQGREHDLGRGRRRTSRSRARSSPRARSPCARRSTVSIRRSASTRPGCSHRTRCRRRLVVLGGGIIGCEFASILRRFGSEVTIIEMLPRLIPAEDEDAAKELAKQFGKRGIALQLEKQCTGVEDKGGSLTVHFGDGETVEADLMLVAVGRAPLVEGLGLEEIGVELDRRKGIAADEHRRTTVPHIYAVGDCAGYWQLAHTAFREGEVAAENAMGHEAVVNNRGRSEADLHRPGDRGRRADRGRGARAVRRRRRGRRVPVDGERAGGDAERDRRLGQVDPRDPLRRAARAGHGRAARHRPGRGRGGRDRRGGDRRDGRGRDDARTRRSRRGSRRPV